MKIIVVGTGHAWTKFYQASIAALETTNQLKLLGVVDPVSDPGTLPEGVWWVNTTEDIPYEAVAPDVAVMILTPDHYSVIEALAQTGFKNIICEKPLVSRKDEIGKVKDLVERYGLKLYAIDFYLPKTLPLQVMLGLIGPDDPRYHWLSISHSGADFTEMLGDIEGVGVQVIEAGDFCLPDIAGRPYLATDKQIGGMILDLITHVCGPLHQAQLLNGWEVLDASLSRLSSITTGHLVPVRDTAREVEMYVTALLSANGIPIQLSLGKVPIERGGLWSLEVRGTKGAYYAGLRTGQPSVLLSKEGTVTFLLKMTPYEFVLREALFYFDGELPQGFDGNFGAFVTSMQVGEGIIARYTRNLSLY